MGGRARRWHNADGIACGWDATGVGYGHLSTLYRGFAETPPESGRPSRDESRKALAWLAAGLDDVECSRVLVRAQEALREPPADFFPSQFDAYTTAYGTLLGTLIGQLGAIPAACPVSDLAGDRLTPDGIWDSLADLFKCAPDWHARRRIMASAASAVDTLADKEAPAAADYGLWPAFDVITSYLIAEMLNPVRSDEADGAAREFVILFGKIVARTAASGPVLREGAALKLSRAARVALAVAIRLEKDRASRIREWATAMGQLRTLTFPEPSTRVHRQLHACAASLSEHARKASGFAERNAYASALQHIPYLQGRPTGPDRKRVGVPCRIELAEGHAVGGQLLNVCADTKRGFAIETTEVNLEGGGPDAVGNWGRPLPRGEREGFDRRELTVTTQAGDAPLQTSSAILTTQAPMPPLVVRCHVVRAWPLPHQNEGTGVALIAADDEPPIDGSWTDWCKYVDGLQEFARYDPYE